MATATRQFVTRLGTLAAARGMSQVGLTQVAWALAPSSVWDGARLDESVSTRGRDAECTGCSTISRRLFEDGRSTSVDGFGISTSRVYLIAVEGNGGVGGDMTHNAAPVLLGPAEGTDSGFTPPLLLSRSRIVAMSFCEPRS